MADSLGPRGDPTRPDVYELRVRGQLGREWADWFGGLSVTPTADGDTLLTGPVADQAALYGLLRQVRDLGMTLVSVGPIDLRRQEASAPEAPTKE